MQKKLYALAALATFALATPSFADNVSSAKAQSTYEATDNGGYDKSDTVKTTDTAGTTTTHTASKKVSVDSSGNTTTKVDIKDKQSPKGLFTKASTSETENTSTTKNGKTETKHVKSINGSTVEKTDDMSTH